MNEGFLGEVRMFVGNFAPRGWILCEGQILAISQNTALFSIIGTNYGGDGRTSYGVPDLRSRMPIGVGRAPGLNYVPALGRKSGREHVSLSQNNLPAHTHTATTTSATADITIKAYDKTPGEGASSNSPKNNVLSDTSGTQIYSNETPNVDMATGAATLKNLAVKTVIGTTGGSTPISFAPPTQGINFIMCIAGTFPSRN